MKVSMNGLRKNLSRDIDTLREIVLLILHDEWYDRDELVDAMNDIIQDSNVLNCVFTDDPEFADISDIAIEHIAPDDPYQSDVQAAFGGLVQTPQC